jgi:ABC-2 type transport system ATP-binding protein
VADSVVILNHGKVIRQAATEDLREQVKRLIAPIEAQPFLAGLPGLLDLNSTGRQATAVVSDIAAVRPLLGDSPAHIDIIDLNLDEIFEAYVIGRKEAARAATDLERVA